MGIATWFEGVGRLLARRGTSASQLLLGPEEFQHAAMCERMRVDRNGSMLSVLMIELSPRRSSTAEQDCLAKHLQSRLRLTDTAGRLPDGRFGVLLPDTPESGAGRWPATYANTMPPAATDRGAKCIAIQIVTAAIRRPPAMATPSPAWQSEPAAAAMPCLRCPPRRGSGWSTSSVPAAD